MHRPSAGQQAVGEVGDLFGGGLRRSLGEQVNQDLIHYGSYTGSGNLVYGSNADGNDIVVEFTSVPEPAFALGAPFLLLLARRRRS